MGEGCCAMGFFQIRNSFPDPVPSANGSENVAVFASIVETAKIRGCSALDIFEALLTEPPETAHGMLFPAAARAG